MNRNRRTLRHVKRYWRRSEGCSAREHAQRAGVLCTFRFRLLILILTSMNMACRNERKQFMEFGRCHKQGQ